MKDKIIDEDLVEYPIQLILSSNGFMTIIYEKENNKADTVLLYNTTHSTANLKMESIQENIEFSDVKHCVVFQRVKANIFSNKKKEIFVKAYIKRA